MTCRTTRVTADLAQLARDKEQLAYLRRERELADPVYAALLDDEICALASKMIRLQRWIDGSPL